MGNAQCCSSEGGGTAPVRPPSPLSESSDDDDRETPLAHSPQRFARAAVRASSGRRGGSEAKRAAGADALLTATGVSPRVTVAVGVDRAVEPAREHKVARENSPTRPASRVKIAGHVCSPNAARSSRAVGVAFGVLEELENACRALDFPLLAEQLTSGESGPRLIAEYDELACADVLQFAVLPATKASGCSFAELLQCEGRVDNYTGQQLVGEADCFVSYAQQCLFKDFVAAINSHPGIEDQYFWLDMLCLDASRRKDDYDKLGGTERVISEVGYTLAVYNHWQDPAAQTQAWCCFELIATALAGNSVEVALPPAETELLNNDLLDGKFDHVIAALCSLDGKLEQGSTKGTDDKEQLVGWLLRQTEKRDVVQCAGNAMRSWLARYSRTVFAAVPVSDVERTSFANDIATLEIELGRTAEAEQLLGELIEVNQQQLGLHHPSTLAACSYLASLHETNDELEKARHYRHRALGGYRKALGDTHPTTQSAIGDMANLLRSCGELSAAEPLYAPTNNISSIHPLRTAFYRSHTWNSVRYLHMSIS